VIIYEVILLKFISFNKFEQTVMTELKKKYFKTLLIFFFVFWS